MWVFNCAQTKENNDKSAVRRFVSYVYLSNIYVSYFSLCSLYFAARKVKQIVQCNRSVQSFKVVDMINGSYRKSHIPRKIEAGKKKAYLQD